MNFKNFILIFFFGIAFYFRVWSLDKGGLWYDEIGSLSVAKESFPFGILDMLYHQDFHCPLFYFLLHLWIKIFGQSEFFLRLFSVVTGLSNLIVIYFAAKQAESSKAGITALILGSLNSLLIYFSQEIRFYNLSVFFVSLILLFLIKLNKNFSVKNLSGLVFANLGLLYTFTLGIIFVFFEIVIFFIYICIRKKFMVKKFILSQAVCGFFFLPYLPTFWHHVKVSSNSFVKTFDWGNFNPIDVFVSVQNFFSPFIFQYHDYYPNTYSMYMEIFGKQDFTYFFLLFVIIPIIIYTFGILKCIARRDILLVLFLIFLCVFSTEVYFAYSEKFILHSRYIVFNLPILIVLAGIGLSRIENKKIYYSMVLSLIFINLIYLVFIPFSAPKMKRTQYYNKVQSVLEKYKFKQEDIIVFNYGTRFIKNYYPKYTGLVFPLDIEYAYFYKDKASLGHIFEEKFLNSLNKNNARENLRSYIGQPESPESFKKYLKAGIIDKMSKNARLAVFINTNVARYSEKELNSFIQSDKKYKETSLARMLVSKTSNDIIETCNLYLKPVEKIDKSEGWKVYIFKKAGK
jgi:uncharacterized membrane protein